MQEVDRRLRRVEKQVEIHLQSWTVRAPKGDKLKAEEAERRLPLVKRLNRLRVEIGKAELGNFERLSLLGRVRASQEALRTQSAGKRWLRDRESKRPMSRKQQRMQSTKKKRSSVWTVSGGLPGLGKGR